MRPPTDLSDHPRFTQRFICGGSWFEEPEEVDDKCQPSHRGYNTAAYCNRFLGFRCVSKVRLTRRSHG